MRCNLSNWSCGKRDSASRISESEEDAKICIADASAMLRGTAGADHKSVNTDTIGYEPELVENRQCLQSTLPSSRLWTRRASHATTNDTHKEQPSPSKGADLPRAPHGRWSEGAAQFLRLLDRCRAREVPPALRASATSAWVGLRSSQPGRLKPASSLSRLQVQPTLVA